MHGTITKLQIWMAIGLVAGSIGTAHAAGTAQQKCQAGKLKAQGKLQACLKKNSAGVLLGKLDVSADCQTNFTQVVQKADAKAAKDGIACRYLDNGDMTVTDLTTGLMWEKKDDGGGLHDKDNTYTWSSTDSSADGTLFHSFLAPLNGGTSADGLVTSSCFANYCDWRLPTVEEQRAVLLEAYPCTTSPCIDAAFGPSVAAVYWASTAYEFNASFAWGIDYADGYSNFYIKTAGKAARAVRGGL